MQENSAKKKKKCILKVPNMLETVRERTSFLGWKIYDKPELQLTLEEQNLIEQVS